MDLVALSDNIIVRMSDIIAVRKGRTREDFLIVFKNNDTLIITQEEMDELLQKLPKQKEEK